MSDSELELFNDLIDVAHPFEIDLNVLVTTSHRLIVEGVGKLEEEETDKTRELLEGEDWEIFDSQIRWQQKFYRDLRKAANHLAVVGLVTRLQHWVKHFVEEKHLPIKKKRGVSELSTHLEALNGSLGQGPIPVEFFEGLLTVRDAVIHADSKTKWQFNGTRTVAARYQDCGELEVTDDQLNDALENAVKQVKWYDARLHPPVNSPSHIGT